MYAITRLDPLLLPRSMYFGITPVRAVQLAVEDFNEGGSGHLMALEMSQMPHLTSCKLNSAFYDFIMGISIEISNGIPVLHDQLDEYPPITFMGLQGTDLSLLIDLSQTGTAYANYV